ncbi:MAG: type II toxin-antitoxin system ParD family antitoxin [Rhodospirillaceae bacterium]|nr:type II toxin-antitoxin system ParD family antitoxin [Rhodospirillaceae bacterium]MDD9916123.1 type II toxin-antitoxin system ParD family antitoxin [Rhodospirillaceae bacterium]MDD9929571.1 type II toxin-antitoxin system ParD family antitoxin [Rhodospirillaceae bacterium]
MNISLSPDQKALVQRLVASGRCRSETDAVNEAFRLLEEDEQFLEDLRHDLRTSLDEANAGDVAPFDQTLADQIKTDGRKALAERGHQDV